MGDQILEAGLFIDEDGKITSERPERGMQIVPEGGTLDDTAYGRVMAHEGLDSRSDVEALIAKVGAEKKPKGEVSKAKAKAAQEQRDADEAAAAEREANKAGDPGLDVTSPAASGKA